MKTQKGFTLIELAVVITIIAILASVALPRLGETTAQAELSNIKDLKSKLSSAAAIYAAEHATMPNGFTDYVESGDTATAPKTIAIGTFGAKGNCTVAAATINCGNAFTKWTTVTYTFNPDGMVTGTAKGTLNGAAETVSF